jgi:hypothetical protein
MFNATLDIQEALEEFDLDGVKVKNVFVDAGSLRCNIQHMTPRRAFDAWQVETNKGLTMFCSLEDAERVKVGDRLTFGSMVRAVEAGPVFVDNWQGLSYAKYLLMEL